MRASPKKFSCVSSGDSMRRGRQISTILKNSFYLQAQGAWSFFDGTSEIVALARIPKALGTQLRLPSSPNRSRSEIGHEDACFDISGIVERDRCLIRAKPSELRPQ